MRPLIVAKAARSGEARLAASRCSRISRLGVLVLWYIRYRDLSGLEFKDKLGGGTFWGYLKGVEKYMEATIGFIGFWVVGRPLY